MIEWATAMLVVAAAIELTFRRHEPELGGLCMQAAGRVLGEMHIYGLMATKKETL